MPQNGLGPAQQSTGTRDYSLLIGTTAVSVFPKGTNLTGLKYMRLWNVSDTATVWISRAGTAAVGTPGSYPLAPGLYEVFTLPQAVPSNPVSAVATAASTPLTVEIG